MSDDPIKIIVIEDDENYAEMIRLALEGLGQITVYPHWPSEAQLEANPNVLWVDLALPDCGPNEVTQRISERRRASNDLVIVVASGYLSAERRKELEDAGVDFMDDKKNRVQPVQIASLIVLGILKAKGRGAKTATSLLGKAMQFMHARFPESLGSESAVSPG